MPRALTNKQLVVLGVVRRHPDGLSAKAVADIVTDEAPVATCSECRGSGKGWSRDGRCRFCCGDGERKPFFHYSDAYQALQRLRKEGLVERRCKRDEWGDELASHVYLPAAAADSDDPLERAFNAPAVGEHRA